MNSPFENLTKLQINKLADLLDFHIYKFKKNDDIYSIIKSNNFIGIVIAGSAQIYYIEYNGNEVIIENLEKDDIFGTNISLINNNNCEIISKEDSEILVIDYNKIINPKNSKYPYYNTFLANLFNIINSKFKTINDRITILEKKQIRDKLLEYFEIEYKKNHSRFIYPPFSLKDLADYIAVNRSAMFRELKNLKEDGLIETKDKRITLLYKWQKNGDTPRIIQFC